MHYRPMLTFDNESPKGNAQVFATEAEALASASDTSHNWINPRISGFTTEKTADSVNCVWFCGNPWDVSEANLELDTDISEAQGISIDELDLLPLKDVEKLRAEMVAAGLQDE